MDGLDNRDEVVVIGVTNRLDVIDPALRRPRQFDVEFCFSLPTLEVELIEDESTLIVVFVVGS
jgi:SpoVK/Ycf46/Vps4 family AAA+-type ATPase